VEVFRQGRSEPSRRAYHARASITAPRFAYRHCGARWHWWSTAIRRHRPRLSESACATAGGRPRLRHVSATESNTYATRLRPRCFPIVDDYPIFFLGFCSPTVRSWCVVASRLFCSVGRPGHFDQFVRLNGSSRWHHGIRGGQPGAAWNASAFRATVCGISLEGGYGWCACRLRTTINGGRVAGQHGLTRRSRRVRACSSCVCCSALRPCRRQAATLPKVPRFVTGSTARERS